MKIGNSDSTNFIVAMVAVFVVTVVVLSATIYFVLKDSETETQSTIYTMAEFKEQFDDGGEVEDHYLGVIIRIRDNITQVECTYNITGFNFKSTGTVTNDTTMEPPFDLFLYENRSNEFLPGDEVSINVVIEKMSSFYTFDYVKISLTDETRDGSYETIRILNETGNASRGSPGSSYRIVNFTLDQGISGLVVNLTSLNPRSGNPSTDYDLSVYYPDGSLLGSSAGPDYNESFEIDLRHKNEFLPTGNYYIEIIFFMNTIGTSWHATVDAYQWVR